MSKCRCFQHNRKSPAGIVQVVGSSDGFLLIKPRRHKVDWQRNGINCRTMRNERMHCIEVMTHIMHLVYNLCVVQSTCWKTKREGWHYSCNLSFSARWHSVTCRAQYREWAASFRILHAIISQRFFKTIISICFECVTKLRSCWTKWVIASEE